MEKRLVQQGDVLFFAIENLPTDIEVKKSPRPGMVTFAEGEVTGHHHSAVVEMDQEEENIVLYVDSAGILWCDVNRETEVTHQEHKPVTLAPGKYCIGIVRECDPFTEEISSVAD